MATLFGRSVNPADLLTKAAGSRFPGRQDRQLLLPPPGAGNHNPTYRALATALTNVSRERSMMLQPDPTLGAPFSSFPNNRLTVAQMGPGEPAENFPLGAEPRQWKYRVGWNFPTTPDTDRGINHELLRALADSSWLVRRCIEIRKAELVGLEWEVVAKGATGKERRHNAEKHAPLIRYVSEFFKYPEGYFSFVTPDDEWLEITEGGDRHDRAWWERRGLVDWSDWFRALLEDYFVGDWVSIWPQRTLGNEMLGFRRVDGATIKALLDLDGRIPPPPMPAWQQYLYGVPRASWAADEFYYWPHVVRNMTPYGFSHLQQGLVAINLALRYDRWNTAMYTENRLPLTLLEAPPGVTPEQLQDVADFLNGVVQPIEGQFRVYPVPNGTKAQALKPFQFDQAFAMYLIEILCAVFDVQPQELGFAPSRAGLGGKGWADAQMEIHRRKTLIPTARWWERKLTRLINEQWRGLGGEDLEFRFTELTSEDQVATYQANEIAIKSGQVSIDEVLEATGRDAPGVGHIMETSIGVWCIDKGVLLTSRGPVKVDLENPPEHADPRISELTHHTRPEREQVDGALDPEDAVQQAKQDLSAWRRRAKGRLREGKRDADPFVSDVLPQAVLSVMADGLAKAVSVQDVTMAAERAKEEAERRRHEAAWLLWWMRWWRRKAEQAREAAPPTEPQEAFTRLHLSWDEQAELADGLYRYLREPVYRETMQRLRHEAGLPEGPWASTTRSDQLRNETAAQTRMVQVMQTYHTDLREAYDRLRSELSGKQSRQEQARAILDALVLWALQRAQWKGRQIAATEATQTEAQAQADFGVQNPAILRQWRWHAVMDDLTCDACAHMDGQLIDPNGPFPPAHPNCRCWVTAEPEKPERTSWPG